MVFSHGYLLGFLTGMITEILGVQMWLDIWRLQIWECA